MSPEIRLQALQMAMSTLGTRCAAGVLVQCAAEIEAYLAEGVAASRAVASSGVDAAFGRAVESLHALHQIAGRDAPTGRAAGDSLDILHRSLSAKP